MAEDRLQLTRLRDTQKSSHNRIDSPTPLSGVEYDVKPAEMAPMMIQMRNTEKLCMPYQMSLENVTWLRYYHGIL